MFSIPPIRQPSTWASLYTQLQEFPLDSFCGRLFCLYENSKLKTEEEMASIVRKTADQALEFITANSQLIPSTYRKLQKHLLRYPFDIDAINGVGERISAKLAEHLQLLFRLTAQTAAHAKLDQLAAQESLSSLQKIDSLTALMEEQHSHLANIEEFDLEPLTFVPAQAFDLPNLKLSFLMQLLKQASVTQSVAALIRSLKHPGFANQTDLPEVSPQREVFKAFTRAIVEDRLDLAKILIPYIAPKELYAAFYAGQAINNYAAEKILINLLVNRKISSKQFDAFLRSAKSAGNLPLLLELLNDQEFHPQGYEEALSIAVKQDVEAVRTVLTKGRVNKQMVRDFLDKQLHLSPSIQKIFKDFLAQKDLSLARAL